MPSTPFTAKSLSGLKSTLNNSCLRNVSFHLFLDMKSGDWINSLPLGPYSKSWQSNSEQSSLVNISPFLLLICLFKNPTKAKVQSLNSHHIVPRTISVICSVYFCCCTLSGSELGSFAHLLLLPLIFLLHCVTCHSERLQRHSWIMYFEVWMGSSF